MDDYAVINRELAAYDEKLAQLPQVVVLNKTDIADPEVVELLRAEFAEEDKPVFVISAATRAGPGAAGLFSRRAPGRDAAAAGLGRRHRPHHARTA